MFSQLIECDKFSAVVDLVDILHAENKIADDLRDYIAEEEDRLNKLKTIADDYEKHSMEGLKDPEGYLGNPINSFLLVKRFTQGWNEVESMIKSNSVEKFLTSLEEKLSLFPDEEDLTGSVQALLRLQDTYALPPSKLAEGILDGVKQANALTAADCFVLGRIAYNSADYYHTALWMDEARKRNEDNEDTGVPVTVLLDYLSFSLYQQGNIRYALNLTLQWLAIEPNHARALSNKQYYIQAITEEEKDNKNADPNLFSEENYIVRRQLDDYRKSPEFATYEALCRGEDVVPNPRAKDLYCSYERPHPYYYIRPLKQELFYHDPMILVYHDLLTDHQNEVIKRLATPRLMRATVQNPQTGILETAYYRISKSAWLKDEEDVAVAAVSGKVQKATGLSLETAEELQVVNYGIGGHYEPHFDFARKDEKDFGEWRGNRIATGIYYMSDVYAGGYTVFPVIGVKLVPEKNSMAFWYNLRASGEGDFNTRHAGCPVLAGSKWVCNKWIHERGQEFVRRCDVDQTV